MNLLIGWNSWSVLEYMYITNGDMDCAIYLRGGYYKNEPDICKLFSVFKQFNLDDYYTDVYAPSTLGDHVVNLLSELQYGNLHIIEEGSYDYSEHEFDDYICKNAIYHSCNLKLVYKKENYKECVSIQKDLEITKKFCSLYRLKLPADYDVIVYTDPLDIDFGLTDYIDKLHTYLNTNYKNKRILIKRHPRDLNTYQYDICDDLIPGQLLLQFPVKHLFIYKTTLLYYLPDNADYEVINMK